MRPDWALLAPHRPLDPGSENYVRPPWSAGDDIAERVMAGSPIILVGGPAGAGKSTELARAATVLRDKGDRVACLAPVDLWENMRKLTPDQLLLRIAGRLAYVAEVQFHFGLSNTARSGLAQAGVYHEPKMMLMMMPFEGSPVSLVRAVIAEVLRLSGQRQITLLIDGMEKVADPAASADLFEALAGLADSAEIVAVVPWNITYRRHDDNVIRPGERWAIVSPGIVEGVEGAPTRAFLRGIVAKRLGFEVDLLDPSASGMHFGARLLGEDVVPTSFVELVERAAVSSGGLARVFLQLVADAGTYARLRRDGDWPDSEDLVDAESDMEDSFRRALQPGDTDAVLKAVGTDGRELELDRKVRLLARGILLERRNGTGVQMEIHPLARRVIKGGAPHA